MLIESCLNVPVVEEGEFDAGEGICESCCSTILNPGPKGGIGIFLTMFREVRRHVVLDHETRAPGKVFSICSSLLPCSVVANDLTNLKRWLQAVYRYGAWRVGFRVHDLAFQLGCGDFLRRAESL